MVQVSHVPRALRVAVNVAVNLAVICVVLVGAAANFAG